MSSPLATACADGDLPSALAAIAGGACVNEIGETLFGTVLPLAAAAHKQHHDVVVWLLSLGADPNGDTVMYDGTVNSTPDILQLLIDTGGDVNRESGGVQPLFWAVEGISELSVRVLLGEPSLDFTVLFEGKTPEQFARYHHELALADMVGQEVRGANQFLWDIIP